MEDLGLGALAPVGCIFRGEDLRMLKDIRCEGSGRRFLAQDINKQGYISMRMDMREDIAAITRCFSRGTPKGPAGDWEGRGETEAEPMAGKGS